MKILKYQKLTNNEYKIITDTHEYRLYDDIIIEYGLLLKKEIDSKDMGTIIKKNNSLKGYYLALKTLSWKMRCEKEIKELLKKKGFFESEINYVLNRLNKEGYLNHETYIEAYIHDALNLNLKGELKIKKELLDLGFKENEINKYLAKVDPEIYHYKIKNYLAKKLKVHKSSALEFKRKVKVDLIKKGFYKEDIENLLQDMKILDNEEELLKIITKLYYKYMKKDDLYTTTLKIKNYLYGKGYHNIDIESYLKKISS